MRIAAAVTDERGAAFAVQDVDIDDPRPGEVRVRVLACGVCHTDAIARDGDLPFPVPGVLGHEGVGRVDAVGDGALVAGGGRDDGSTALARPDGSPLHSHFFGQSSFAEHAIVTERAVVKIETSAPLEAVGTLACGIATGAGAVLNALRLEPGSSLVVYGAGAVGLAAIMAARLTPATGIVAVEPNAGRRELATKYGATEVVDPRSVDDVVATVQEICGGPADAALDCTGIVPVLRQAIDTVGMLGTAVLIGGAPAGAEFSADHISTLWGKRIIGTLGGEGQTARFVPALLRLHEQGRFPFTDLVEYFPLDQVNEAVAASHHGEVVKPVLRIAG